MNSIKKICGKMKKQNEIISPLGAAEGALLALVRSHFDKCLERCEPNYLWKMMFAGSVTHFGALGAAYLETTKHRMIKLCRAVCKLELAKKLKDQEKYDKAKYNLDIILVDIKSDINRYKKDGEFKKAEILGNITRKILKGHVL